MSKKSLQIKKIRRILAIGAHFDDVESGIGGTLLKHADREDDIYISVLEADEFRTGEPEIRIKEQLNAMKFYGIGKDKLIAFTSDCDQPEIISELDKIKPDIIYAPYYKDTHGGHHRCSKIAQSVGRKRHITTIFYCCGSSIEFHPNLFSVIDFEKKMELFNCHKTQVDCGALKLNIREKMESYWAALISTEDDYYAEGLIIRKMIYKV